MLNNIAEIKQALRSDHTIIIDMIGEYDDRKKFIYRGIRLGVLITYQQDKVNNWLIVSLNKSKE